MASTMRRASGLLKEYWYPAARSSEVSDRRPLGRTVLGELLVLWRERGGRAVALLDRCLHRNMLLSRGEVFDGLLGCPYHGWTYDHEGRCVCVPASGPDGAPFEDARLESFPVREQHGVVWVWMGGARPPDKDPPPRPHWNEPGWWHHTMVSRTAGDVTAVAENFMDVPHTLFVHRGLFRSRARRRLPAVVERRDDGVTVAYHQPDDRVGLGGRLLNPRGLPVHHVDRFVLPGIVRVDYAFGEEQRAISVTNACAPVSDVETAVYTLIAFKLGALSPLMRLVVPLLARTIMRQDARVVAGQSRAIGHYGGAAFHSAPSDVMHDHLAALRAWAASGGQDPRPATGVDHVDIWV